MISIDTELLKQLVMAADTANEEINDALELLQGIVQHNDWGCREKDAINDNSASCKRKAVKIQENSSMYLAALRRAADRFENDEKGIGKMISGVESIISAVQSIIHPVITLPPHVAGGVAGSITDILEDIVKSSCSCSWLRDIFPNPPYRRHPLPISDAIPIVAPIPGAIPIVADIADIADTANTVSTPAIGPIGAVIAQNMFNKIPITDFASIAGALGGNDNG